MTPEREAATVSPGERYGYSDCPVAPRATQQPALRAKGRRPKRQFDFASANYWTSTENNSTNSWNVNFTSGNTNNNNKTNTNRRTRCVRE